MVIQYSSHPTRYMKHGYFKSARQQPKLSHLNKIHTSKQCMGKIFCVDFQYHTCGIPHQISDSYNERYDFKQIIEISGDLRFESTNVFWNSPCICQGASPWVCEDHRFAEGLTCEPVTTTGLPRFSNMKESAEAVYAIVSVPWRMTKLSNLL